MSTRSTPLAVLLPEIGLASETFIRWDVDRLLPGRTAIVADPPPGGLSVHGQTTWSLVDQPCLAFEPIDGDPDPSPGRVAAALSFLESHGVEVVLIEYLDFAARWFDHLRRADLRVWVRGHGIDLSARMREQRWIAAYQRFADANGIIVPSQHAAERLTATGLPASKIHVVRYCVTLPPPALRPDASAVRCVAVGRLVHKKAPLLTLEAFRQAHLVVPHLTLDLIGDGPLSNQVHDFVLAHGLGDYVRLHGRLPHDRTLRIIRNSDILLHHAVTSPDGDMEGQPLAVLEAMAAGLPVVSTHHAGIPEIITNGTTGRLVAEHDVSGMATAIIELAADEALRSRLGRAATDALSREHTDEYARRRLRELLRLGTAQA